MFIGSIAVSAPFRTRNKRLMAPLPPPPPPPHSLAIRPVILDQAAELTILEGLPTGKNDALVMQTISNKYRDGLLALDASGTQVTLTAGVSRRIIVSPLQLVTNRTIRAIDSDPSVSWYVRHPRGVSPMAYGKFVPLYVFELRAGESFTLHLGEDEVVMWNRNVGNPPTFEVLFVQE